MRKLAPEHRFAMQAAHAAKRRLMAAHLEEYEALYREERVARGLPPESVPTVVSARLLRERVAELEAQLAEKS